MSNLLYNSSTDVLVTRNDMRYLETPQPMGSRHNPVPFAGFADSVYDAINNSGYVVDNEQYAITKDQQRMFGMLQISPRNELAAKTGWQLCVGLRGAHDQKISRGVAIGSRVMVCSNLCFHGDLGNWKTRQTTNIADRLPGMVADAVSGISRAHNQLTIDFDRFNSQNIELNQGDEILVDIFRSGGFSASQLGRAIKDWKEPSVPEHTSGGRNLWWLFNSATEALKPTGNNVNHDDLRKRSTIVFSKIKKLAETPKLPAIIH